MPTEQARRKAYCSLGSALVFVAVAVSCYAAPRPLPLSGDDIVGKMVSRDRARLGQLVEYTSSRRYFLENKRWRKTAEAHVKLRYSHRGIKEFAVIAEAGSKVIRQKVFRRMMDSELEASRAKMRQATQITPDNYEFRFVGSDSDRGRAAYVFDISPKTPSKFMVKGRVWIDAEDFAISRVEGSPAINPSIWIRSTRFVHTYEKFGPFWLAVSNVSETDAVVFGHTTVEIQYSDYSINPNGSLRHRLLTPDSSR